MINLGMVTYNVAKDWDVPTIVGMCQRTGFQGVELRTTHAHGVELSLTPDERATVKQRFEDGGVLLWCLGSTCEYHSADPAVVRANIEETKEWVKLALDVGAVGVKVRPNSFVDGVPEQDTLRQIGAALRECGEFAEVYGVELMLEVHGHGTCEPRHIETILKACDHPLVGATWNCNQQDIADGSITPNFRRLEPWVWSAHIHDLYEDYPYHEFIALLKAASFDGFCLIEMPESCEPERLLQYYSRLWAEWTK
jgi:sugar phosphate isomerase/epimerase